jgi:hypothetical protein
LTPDHQSVWSPNRDNVARRTQGDDKVSKHSADKRRLVDMTAEDLAQLVDQRLEEFLASPREPANEDLLDKAAAAKFLAISPSQLDRLIRERKGPPFSVVGEARRFDRQELKAWAKGPGK